MPLFYIITAQADSLAGLLCQGGLLPLTSVQPGYSSRGLGFRGRQAAACLPAGPGDGTWKPSNKAQATNCRPSKQKQKQQPRAPHSHLQGCSSSAHSMQAPFSYLVTVHANASAAVLLGQQHTHSKTGTKVNTLVYRTHLHIWTISSMINSSLPFFLPTTPHHNFHTQQQSHLHQTYGAISRRKRSDPDSITAEARNYEETILRAVRDYALFPTQRRNKAAAKGTAPAPAPATATATVTGTTKSDQDVRGARSGEPGLSPPDHCHHQTAGCNTRAAAENTWCSTSQDTPQGPPQR